MGKNIIPIETARKLLKPRLSRADIKSTNSFFENSITRDDLGFDRLVSPRLAAELLDVSPKFIYECIARKEIPAERIGNRLRRIRLSALETWLAANRKDVQSCQ